MKFGIKLSLLFLLLVVMIKLTDQSSSRTNNSIVQPIPKSVLKPAAAYERQQFFLDKRLPQGQHMLPMDPYRPAINQIKSRAKFSSKSNQFLSKNKATNQNDDNQWEWLGPGNVGGRTRALVFHPDNAEIMYAGGVSGGVWKTENAGGQWRALADNMANINVGALAIDQVDPDILYAGTGELYRKTLRPYSSMTGAGLFKTTDGGETWFQLEQTVNENFLYISDIVISPSNHLRIYAATNTGVWRSDDGGVSFQASLTPTDNQGQSIYEGCNDLAIRSDQLDNDWVLVSCSSRSTDDRYFLPGLLPDACNGPCDASIYVNTEAEQSNDWQLALTEPGMGRTQMTVHLANQNIMYASSANTDGGPDLSGDGQPDLHNGLHAIFYSDDGGLTWQARLRNTNPNILNTQLFSYAEGALASFCNAQTYYYSAGWYNQAIAVSPTDPNELWVAGMEIYRSNDGGRNFGMASHWDALYFTDPRVYGAYVHADQHALIFHPDYDGVTNKTLYAANDGGVYLTDDSTQPVFSANNTPCAPPTNGVKWRQINNNYGVTQFYAGDVFSDGKSYIAGAQDNGTQYGSDANGVNNWAWINGGDGADLAINPSDDNNFYVSSQNANIRRTNDGGNSYVRVGLPGPGSLDVTQSTLDNSGLNRIFITPFEIDPNDNNRLFLGAQRLWRSDDQGNNWVSAGTLTGNNYNDLISALAVAPGNSNRVLYANSHSIYLVNNALSNQNFFQTLLSSPRQGWVSSLAYEPGNINVAYATYSTFGGTHVWKSTNGGVAWSPLDGSGEGALPDVPVHKIVIDPTNTQRLYLGTDLGVFVSLDGGQNWAEENTGFSQVITEDLVIRQAPGEDPYLFAFTYGRGVWRVPLSELNALPDYQADDQISGSWFNSGESGHGLQLEMLDNNGTQSLLATWFVFKDDKPMWLIGVGEVQGNSVDIDMQITSNTGFPIANFNSQDINTTFWGTIKLQFDTNQSGQLIWSSSLPGFGNGSLSIERFTQLASTTNNNGINGCHSGSWYSPSQDGHGFMAEILENNAGTIMLMTWYTYVDGEQVWMVGNGPVEGNSATLSVLYGAGGQFPPNFDPDEVNFEPWGTFTFDLIDNNNATISWTSTEPGFSSDELDVTRLTSLSGLACE